MALVSPVPGAEGFAGRAQVWERHFQEQVLVGQAELLGRCSAASEEPPELHPLSCWDWQMLKAPQGLVFTWFGMVFIFQ